MDRRAFLATPALALRAQAPKVRVGAHCWVYAARQPGYDPTPVLDQIFQELSRAGLHGVELMHHCFLHEGAPRRLRELAREHGLAVIGTSWSGHLWDEARWSSSLEQCCGVIRALGELGGGTLGISVGDAGRKKSEAELDRQADALRRLFDVCRDYNVHPNLHNHVYEVRDGEHDLKGTLKRLPFARLGPDLGWLFRAKVDPVDFLKRHGSQVVFAHLRNEKPDGRWPEDLTEGVIDYAAIGKTLHDIGFEGDLMIELAHEKDFTPTRSLGESVRRSRAFVARTMNY